ncbi:MAG: hypothetical protein JXQ72_04130 [Anaerolineae bacterium]|nr:hypothetical protein [Anaerolineae bacterium]
MGESEPRAVTPLDLPLVRRVLPQHLPLDMTAALSRGISGMEDALLSAVPLTDLGAPTVVFRKNDCGYVGQLRLPGDKTVAHLTFLAPEPGENETHEWTRLLEALTLEAGKRGAHLLKAEIDENHPVFVAFRLAGFAVYARHVILRRAPRRILNGTDAYSLRPQRDQDTIPITTLYTNTVPRLLQLAEPLSGVECNGLVYERDGQIAGYLVIIEGKSGVVIKPYFHPEVYDQAAGIILSALKFIPRAEQQPVYLYARAYQDWLRGALERVEFEPWAHQALMVKYALVRVERVETGPLPALEPNHLRPPVIDGPIPLRKQSRLAKLNGRRPLWWRNGN